MTGIATTFVATNQPTAIIAVPGDKQFNMFGQLGVSARQGIVDMVIVTSGSVVAQVAPKNLDGLNGPVDIRLDHQVSGAGWITYSLSDSSVVQLPSGAISTSGTSVLSVEKSSDMTNWAPASIMLNDGSPQSFYRLKGAN